MLLIKGVRQIYLVYLLLSQKDASSQRSLISIFKILFVYCSSAGPFGSIRLLEEQ